MGCDKALLELGRVTLLERAARLLEGAVSRVSVIGPQRPLANFTHSFLADDFPGAGPLGGIATAVRAAREPWCLVVACDLPYLTRDWLDFLIGFAARSGADAVLPANERGPEPLCAMYSRHCHAKVVASLERGIRKVTDGLTGLRVEQLPMREWKRFDSGGGLFKNMNTPEDYQEAQAHFE